MAKKRIYYKKKAVLKAISNYTRRKLCYITDVYFHNNQTTIDGENGFNINDCLLGNINEYQTLGKQYAQVKLRGVRIDATYSYGEGAGYDYFLGIFQTNDNINFDNAKNQPNIMMLSKNATTRMYYKMGGEFTPTNTTNIFSNIKLMAFCKGLTEAGVQRWTIKITLYLTFKSNL